jgi:hypothetical protein
MRRRRRLQTNRRKTVSKLHTTLANCSTHLVVHFLKRFKYSDEVTTLCIPRKIKLMYRYSDVPFLRAVFNRPAKAEGRLPGVVEVGIYEVSLYEILVLGKLLLHSRLQLDISRVLPWGTQRSCRGSEQAAIRCLDSSLAECRGSNPDRNRMLH